MSIISSNNTTRKAIKEDVLKFDNALKIDKNEIEASLVSLRKSHDEMITACDTLLLDQLNNVKSYVVNFHGTASYKDFFELVIKYFGDIKEPLPGTIGAFFIGYYAYKGDLDNIRCAATCVDSIPLPDATKDKPCTDNVVVLYRHNTKTYCKPIHLEPRATKSYIHLMGDITNNNIKDHERALLASFGIVKGEIYTYIDGTYKHVNTYSNLTMIRPHRHSNYRSKGNNTALFVALLIFLVIVIIISSAWYSSLRVGASAGHLPWADKDC